MSSPSKGTSAAPWGGAISKADRTNRLAAAGYRVGSGPIDFRVGA